MMTRPSTRAEAELEGWKKGVQDGLEQGIQQGLAQGIQQGLEQGVQQGQRLQQIRIAQSLKQSGSPIDLAILT